MDEDMHANRDLASLLTSESPSAIPVRPVLSPGPGLHAEPWSPIERHRHRQRAARESDTRVRSTAFLTPPQPDNCWEGLAAAAPPASAPASWRASLRCRVSITPWRSSVTTRRARNAKTSRNPSRIGFTRAARTNENSGRGPLLILAIFQRPYVLLKLPATQTHDGTPSVRCL